MTAVNAFPDHVFGALDGAMRRLNADLAGYRAASELTQGLRASHLRLVSLVPDDGLRLTDLAVRVGMSKQALGEFADALEQRGLLETLRDPADRRVRIIRRTDAGRRLADEADEAIRTMERRWRDALGPERWDAMVAVLTDLAGHDEPPAP